LFSRAQLDVGIGVAIYLSEGIADTNVQLLNPARCGPYPRRDFREDVGTISLYAAIAGRSVDQTALVRTAKRRREANRNAQRAREIERLFPAPLKNKVEELTTNLLNLFRPRQKYCQYQRPIEPAPRLCFDGSTVSLRAGWGLESNEYEVTT
jgi:hypothetical protein